MLAPILPATLKSFDLRPLGRKGRCRCKVAGPLAGLKLPAGAAANWLHELTPTSRARQVALTAGGKPALILGGFGKGRVALLGIAPLGEDFPALVALQGRRKITEAACRWLLRMR